MGLNMPAAGSIALERNFYGSLSVHQHMLIDEDDSNKRYPTRYISHGTTIHGYQILDDNLALTPIAYYLPLRSLFDAYEPRNVMVMGLGAGNLNCYSGPDSRFSFIEIDPAVVDMARKHFTYLSRCSPNGKEPRILMGDGRKVMEKITDEKFDMILVDVFSSDYIPAHLMTREAIRIYMDRLADGGVLLFHISNLFFDLSTPIGAAAKDLNLDMRVMRYAGGRAFYDTASTWVALSNDNGSLNDLDSRKWQRESLPDNAKAWTDDYSDFMSALLIFKDN
jgi:spermidine synthase